MMWIITGICKTRLQYHSSDHQVSAPFAPLLQHLSLTSAQFLQFAESSAPQILFVQHEW